MSILKKDNILSQRRLMIEREKTKSFLNVKRKDWKENKNSSFLLLLFFSLLSFALDEVLENIQEVPRSFKQSLGALLKISKRKNITATLSAANVVRNHSNKIPEVDRGRFDSWNFTLLQFLRNIRTYINLL